MHWLQTNVLKEKLNWHLLHPIIMPTFFQALDTRVLVLDLIFHHLTVVWVSFCSLMKGITSNICMLCFVPINSVLLNYLYVWILKGWCTIKRNIARENNGFFKKIKLYSCFCINWLTISLTLTMHTHTHTQKLEKETLTTYTHIHTYTCMQLCVHTCTHTHTHAHAPHTHAHTHACTHVRTRTHTHTHTYANSNSWPFLLCFYSESQVSDHISQFLSVIKEAIQQQVPADQKHSVPVLTELSLLIIHCSEVSYILFVVYSIEITTQNTWCW